MRICLLAACWMLCGCGAVDALQDAGPTSDAGSHQDAGTSPDAGHEGPPFFCTPCLQGADCGGGANMCLGDPGHCGLDCSQGNACPVGSTCEGLSNGKGPMFHQCVPTTAACGDLTTRPQLDCSDGWTGFASGFFAQCETCHPGVYSSASAVRAATPSVRSVIDFGTMPQGVIVSDAERLRVLTWLGCGAP